MSAGLRIDLTNASGYGWMWRMWSGSRIVGGSTESYVQRASAIRNIETVTGGQVEKISTPDSPVPYGILHRGTWDGIEQSIPVRLVES